MRSSKTGRKLVRASFAVVGEVRAQGAPGVVCRGAALELAASDHPRVSQRITARTADRALLRASLMSAVSIVSALMPGIAWAQQTTTWTGGGADTNWTTTGNWQGGTNPTSASNSNVNFTNTSGSFSSNFNYGSVYQPFSTWNFNTSSPFTLTSASTSLDLYFKLENFGAQNASVTVANIALQSAVNGNEFNATSTGNLTVNVNSGGSIFNNGKLLTIRGQSSGPGGSVTINAPISGSGGITLTQNAIGVLSGANTFTGGVTVSSGTLIVNGSSTFSGGAPTAGSIGTGSLTLANGTTLAAAGNSALGSSSITINGDVNVGATGALARLVLNGPINLNGTAPTNGNAGTTRTLTLSSSFNAASFSGGTSGANNLGIEVQTNGPANSVANGTLRVIANASTPASNLVGTQIGAIAFTGNSGLTIANKVVTVVSAGTPFLTATAPRLSIESGGYFNASGGSQAGRTINVFSLAGGGVFTNLTTGASSLNAPLTISGNDTTTFSGQIADGSTFASTFAGISGIAGTVSLTMNGTGTQVLSGNNAYSGGTTLNSGTLALNSATAIGTGTLTIAGGALDSTLSGGVTLSTNNAQNWNGNFAFTGTNNLNLGTGGVTLSATRTVTVNASTLTVGGAVGGAFGLTKAGNGTLVLSGASGYTGLTTVSAGVLNVQNNTGLGTSAAGTSVTAGAALQLQGGLTVGAEALTLNGSGISSDGALRNVSGNNDYTGLVTLGSATRINSDSGTLTLSNSGTITGATFGLTVGGAGNVAINSIIGTISGTVTKDGAGTLTLGGANTFTGGTVLSAGTLNINNAGTGSTNSAIGTGTLTIGGIATIDNTSSGSVAVATNNVQAWNADFTFTGTQSLNLGTGAVTLGGSRTVTVSANTLTVGGAIGGAFGLTKAGAGTLVLGGSNTFTGSLAVQQGTLSIASINNVSANGTLGNSATAVSLGSSGNTATLLYTGTGATASSTRPLTLASGGTGAVTVANSTTNLTLSGLIDGSGALQKSGPGVLTVSGQNTFTGGTTLSQGTLTIGSDAAVSSSTLSTGPLGKGGLTIEDGTTLSANGGRYLAVTTLKLNGNFTLGAPGSGRLSVDGTWDLNGANRTITLGRASASYASGLELLRFGNSTTAGQSTGTPVVKNALNSTNYTLSFITTTGDNSTGTPAIARTLLVPNFENNTGLRIGDGVAYSSNNSSAFGTGTNAPTLTLDAPTSRGGGVLQLGDGVGTMRSAEVYSLSGGGTVSASNTTLATQIGTLTVNNGGPGAGATFSGSITEVSGGGIIAFTKSGSGTQTLSGANNYSGPTNVNGGTLVIGNVSALGTGLSTTARRFSGNTGIAGNGITTVASGATLDLNGRSLTGEAITLNGTGVGGAGALINNGNPVTISDNGQAIASLTIATNGSGATVSATPTVAVSNSGITGFAATAGIGVTSLVVSGGGSGYTNGSTFTGPNGLAGTIVVSSNAITSFTITNPGFGFAALPTIADLTISGGGTGASINSTSSTLGLTGVTVTNWGTGFNASPTVTLATGLATEATATVTPMALNLASTSAVGGAGDISLSIPVIGSGGLTKVGGGTLTLGRANTYSGVTTVSADGGTLQFAKSASLYNGTTASWTRANVIVNSGATLALNVGGTGEFSAADVTTILTNVGGAVTNNGFRSGSAVAFDTTNAAGGSFNFPSVIANTTGTGGGAVGLTKLGANTLVLTGANTNTGPILVSAGTLQVGAGGTAGRLGSGAVTNNGSLVFNRSDNYGGAVANVISGSGSVTVSSGSLTLSGANTYTGVTTVSAGSLLVSGSLADAAGAVTVASGATLSTKGAASTLLSRDVNVNGTFAPGDDGSSDTRGTANLNGRDLALAGSLTLDLNTQTTSGGDLVDNVDNLTLGGTIDFNFLGGGQVLNTLGTRWPLVNYASRGGASLESIQLNGLPSLNNNWLWGLTETANGSVLTLNLEVVPEPLTIGAAGLIGLQLLRRRRVCI